MNELELIRRQLSVERHRAAAVADVCAAVAAGRALSSGAESAPRDFVQACVDYLACVLAWFEERDQRLADLARRLPAGEQELRRGLEEALARPGRSREALEKLERAMAALEKTPPKSAPRLWQDFADHFDGVWSARRAAIDIRLAEVLHTADWRAIAGIDADSMLEERRRYARVQVSLPAGVSLTEPVATD